MRTTYYDEDDVLVIHTHISYAADGSAVEVVVLEARAHGAFPTQVLQTQPA
jgi:hypothetical protein